MKHKAGMFVYAFAFLLGVVIVQQLPDLPDFSLSIVLILCLSGFYLFANKLLVLRYSFCQQKTTGLKSYITLIYLFILLIILGFMYAAVFAKHQLNYLLDESLVGQSVLISGQISTIPETNRNAQRFEFDVDSYRFLAQNNNVPEVITERFPKKLRLSWYYGNKVKAAEKWQLEVRLKPPHGFINPGGFDYEAWLYQQAIDATGYVRKSDLNRRLQIAPVWSINRFRQIISEQIDAVAANQMAGTLKETPSLSSALIKALAIGDKSSISTSQWLVLTNTGISHLMAISGLHIGLAALFAYMLIRYSLPVYIMKRLPAQHVALFVSMVIAFHYALLAGLSIPTQRAIIMLFSLSMLTLIRRNTRPVDSLGLALLLVLLIDPNAVLSAGFWFSFSAVAVIYISVMTAYRQSEIQHSLLIKLGRILKQWIRLQLMISVILLPLSLYMFQQVSLISPVVNLILIPYVSFLVVPLILIAIVSSFLSQVVAEILFNLASRLLDVIWPVLSYLSERPYAIWVRGDFDIVDLVLVSTAILLTFFGSEISRFILVRLNQAENSKNRSVYWSIRLLAGLLFLPLIFTKKSVLSPGEYQLTVLDVGQGSAAVIQTQNHTMIFDSGAKFSDKMDAGSSVIIPYLRSQGIKRLDQLVISHGDNDHIGGAQALLNYYKETDLVGQDIDELVLANKSDNNKQNCFAGLQWLWDEVNFEFISPEKKTLPSIQSPSRNNGSCVLRVSSQYGSVLFTGDIEKKVENRLLNKYGSQLATDILMVPHHGSNTSSSHAFINVIDPKYSLISVGYKNKYKLPGKRAMARLKTLNSELIQTDKNGAITIKLLSDEGIVIERYRDIFRKYWHHKLK